MRKTNSMAIAIALSAVAMVLPSSASASPHDPVLFVHGWTSSSSVWNTMIPRFQSAGWDTSELATIDYGSQSNVTIASMVNTKVNQLLAANPGKTKVDLVSHSMGGLSTRYFVKNLGGTANVDDFVSLGGPNHGTGLATLCAWFSVQCREMSPYSSFLRALNATDETPGAVNYGTWWSNTDGIIIPPTSTILSGATNTQTANISHGQLTTDATVAGQVISFVS